MKRGTKYIGVIVSICILFGLSGCNMRVTDQSIAGRDLNEKYGEEFEVSSEWESSVGTEGIAYPIHNPAVKFPYIIRDNEVASDQYIGTLLTMSLDSRLSPIVEEHLSTGYVYCTVVDSKITSTDTGYTYEQYKNDVGSFIMHIMVEKEELDQCTIDDLYACVDDIITELGDDCSVDVDFRAVTQSDIEKVKEYRRNVAMTSFIGSEYSALYCMVIDILDGQYENPYEENKERFARASGKREQECPDDIDGMYIHSVDDSTLSIYEESENNYHVELTLYRLTYIDDFTGEYENGILTVTGTDAAGNPITAEITFFDEEATMTFTDSTWTYLENGRQYLFSKE